MILPSEQEKSNPLTLEQNQAKSWLARELCNIKFEQLLDRNWKFPTPDGWCLCLCPIDPEQYHQWEPKALAADAFGTCARNLFLENAITLAAVRPEGYEKLLIVAKWLGVDLGYSGGILSLRITLAEKLLAKVPHAWLDGKRSIIQLVADAIIPEPLTKKEKEYVEIGEFINTLPFEIQESRKKILKAIADEFSKENKDIGKHTFTCQKRKASDALVWLEETGRYQPIHQRRGRNKPTKNDLQMARQKARQMEGRCHA